MRASTPLAPPRTVLAAAVAAIVLPVAAFVLTPGPVVFAALLGADWSFGPSAWGAWVYLILWLVAPILLVAFGVGVLRASHQARMGIWGISGLYVLRLTLVWLLPGVSNTPAALEVAVVLIPSLLLATPSARTYFRRPA